MSTNRPSYIINNHLNEQYCIESVKTINSKFISQSTKHINKSIDTKTQHILSKLNHCNDIKSVLNTIHQSNASHISVYAKALQICNKLSLSSSNNNNDINHEYIKTIFTMIESEDISLNIYFFGILFNVLSKTKINSNDLLYYFQKMYSLKHKIKPNSIILSTILKCCRKCNDIKLTEKILFLLKGIKLDKFGLNELIVIYGNNQQIDKAKLYFNKLCNLDTSKSIIIGYGSMLNAYAEIGDISSIKAMINTMKKDKYLKEQLTKSSVIYTALMKGYANCTPSKPEKMLSVFDIMVNNTDCKIIDAHINMKATAYNRLIMNCMDSEKDAFKYLDKLLNELPKERERLVSSYNKYSQQLASLQLKGCIIAYKYDFDAIVPIFEQQLQEHIGYWRKLYDDKNKSEKYVLDFYHFSEIITRFILKYIFKYQQQQLLDAMDDNGYIQILCQDTLPDKYKTNNSDMKFQENSTLKNIIKDEILCWNKCIDIETDPHHPDILFIKLNSKVLEKILD